MSMNRVVVACLLIRLFVCVYWWGCCFFLLQREVERCLQEFFKTHQEGWEFEHRAAFTEEQLDALDTYKGRPTYFA